jgi:hypothetical protein
MSNPNPSLDNADYTPEPEMSLWEMQERFNHAIVNLIEQLKKSQELADLTLSKLNKLK